MAELKDSATDAAERAHTQLLVSIPNVKADPRPSCLLHVDLTTERKKWVDTGYGDLLVSGRGIDSDERFVYHLCVAKAGFKTVLTVLERDTLEFVHVQILHEVYDAHSLRRIGDELMVASTGTDQVLAYPIEGVVAGTPHEVWSPTGSGTDTHHVNSLTYAHGHLYCSAFGPKEEDSGWWSTAQRGYIRDITAGVTVLKGLRQPHSATWYDGQLFVCNSQEGTLNLGDEVVAYLSGYSRGLAFGSDGTVYVGTSIARKRSTEPKDAAVFFNPADQGQWHGQCAVVQMALSGTNRVERAIPPFGDEIYDIMVL